MVSVPPVSLGNAAGWAEARIPSTENTGMTSMLQAAALGQQAQLRKQEIEKGKKAAKDEKRIEQYQSLFVDAHAVKDRKLMAEAINGIAEINPDKAKQVKDTWFNLDRTDAVSGAMALQAAAASPTDEGQKAALKQAYDTFSMSSVPLAESVKGIMDTPFGEKRDTQIFTGIKVAQAMGLLPAPKDIWPAGGSTKDLSAVQSSRHFDDGTIGFLTKGGKSYFTNREGKIVEGTERQKAVMNMMAERITTEGAKTKVREKAKATESNYQATIEKGKLAADSIYDAVHAVDLLSKVETGGLEGFKLYMKNKLGISSGDAASLSTILARNVFKQIKPTFGGDPSVQESQWLKETEARIGQSTEGNLSVINDMVDRYTMNMDRARAEAAAQDPPDEATIRYIDNAKAKVLEAFGKKQSNSTTSAAAAPQGNAAFQKQTPYALPPRMPSMGYNENANRQRAEVLNAAQRMGIRNPDPLKLRYSKSTGKYGYKMPNGEIIVIEMPNM